MKQPNSTFRTVRGYQLMEKNKNLLTASMEDYLEMLYRETLSDDFTRISTLATLLNVNPSSATKMVQRLAKHGMVSYQKYGIIRLTDKGHQLGKFLYERHGIIETFLCFITSRKDCLHETELLEHSINPDTLHWLDLFNRYLSTNPHILEQFRLFCRDN